VRLVKVVAAKFLGALYLCQRVAWTHDLMAASGGAIKRV
jgi:hypothetical protein